MRRPKVKRPRWQAGDCFEASRGVFRDAAYALIRDGGLATLSMRGLATTVGASPMTAYRYYADKDTLVEDVRRIAWRNFAQHMGAAGEGAPISDERFRRMCRGYLTFAVEHEPEYKLLFEEKPSGRASFPRAPEDAEAWSLLTMAVRDVNPGLDDGRVLSHAHLIWASLHGLATLHLSHKLVFSASVSDVLEEIASSLLFVVHGS